jgi:HlyD family secretion protein
MLVAAAGAAALLVVLILLLRGASNRTAAPSASAAAQAVTARTLETMQVARGVTANGTVYAWQEIVVGPEVGGYRVAAVNVDVGDRVRKGQELVRLAEDLLAAEVASKRANLEQAQASAENAASAYRRAHSLSGSGALSQSDVDKLRSEELAARARVEVSKADLHAADLRLRHTRVTAPDDGVISARSVNVGQVAQVGTEMLRLLRKGRVEWRAEIPESRMREIRVGQNVKLTTADGAQLDGKVRAIAPTIESSTRAGLVYVDIPSTGAARPGMFARGEILLGQAAANLAPLSSVVTQDGYTYVFVVTDQQLVARRRVETGAVRDKQIEIVSGVEPGERIVDKGAGFLKDGDRVRVVLAAPDGGAGS